MVEKSGEKVEKQKSFLARRSVIKFWYGVYQKIQNWLGGDRRAGVL